MINKGYLTAKTNKESDEVFTPKYAVRPILKYIKDKKLTIWCPFDKKDSNFVQLLKEEGHHIIYSHIDNGENFFNFEPKLDYDCIISNPPFSIKDDILKRLNELNKPFAILMPLNVLQGQKRFKYLQNIQALIFDKRIDYLKENNGKKEIQKGVSFASIYLCKNFLPKDLIIEELKKET